MKHSIHTALVVILIVSFAAGLILAAEPIPFSLKRGIPEIEVIINDSIKASFVIDTGADHIYIDKTFAEKHGLLSGRTQPMRPTRGSKGSTEAKLFRVESLKFGDISLSDLSIVSIDLVSQIKDTSMGYPDGVLGYSFLKDYKIYLNYPESTLAFQDPDSIDTKEKLVLRFPFTLVRHLITIDVEFNNGIKTKMILDLGSSYSILSTELAEKMRVSDSINIEWMKFGNGVRTNPQFLIRDLSEFIGTLSDSSIEGVLGTSFLSGRLVIDYRNQIISQIFIQESY